VTYLEDAETQDVTTPPGGTCDGMGRGALTGMLWDGIVSMALAYPGAGGGPYGVIWVFGALAAGIAFLPVAALAGSIYGGIAAPSAEEVDGGLATIQRVIINQRMSREITLKMVEARGGRTDADLTFLEPGVDRDCFDTILQVGKPVLMLKGLYGVNPSLTLSVRVSACLSRVSDGATLCRFDLTRSRPVAYGFLEWAGSEGRVLRSELEGAVTDLAVRFVDEFFLLRLLPQDRAWKAPP